MKSEFDTHKKKDCAACHSGANKDGDFTIDVELTPEMQEKVLVRLRTSDLKKRMPRTKSGEAGPLVSDRYYLLWKLNPK